MVIHDLTDEMPKIINHWISENIKFDAIYTGYIGDIRQFEYILKCKEFLLKEDGLFIVDPAMADHGKMYPALVSETVEYMKQICSVADYIIPNITEAAFLTDNEYNDNHSNDYINKLLDDLSSLGAKNVILSGICVDNYIGAAINNGNEKHMILKEKVNKFYHGTGDIFSSIIVANILNGHDLSYCVKDACEFVINSIKETLDDPEHEYAVKFENVLEKERK